MKTEHWVPHNAQVLRDSFKLDNGDPAVDLELTAWVMLAKNSAAPIATLDIPAIEEAVVDGLCPYRAEAAGDLLFAALTVDTFYWYCFVDDPAGDIRTEARKVYFSYDSPDLVPTP
jgi:hypothetical protein